MPCCHVGGGWEGFNEKHRMNRHNVVRMCGIKPQLYRGLDLMQGAIKHTFLPLFAVQARVPDSYACFANQQCLCPCALMRHRVNGGIKLC